MFLLVSCVSCKVLATFSIFYLFLFQFPVDVYLLLLSWVFSWHCYQQLSPHHLVKSIVLHTAGVINQMALHLLVPRSFKGKIACSCLLGESKRWLWLHPYGFERFPAFFHLFNAYHACRNDKKGTHNRMQETSISWHGHLSHPNMMSSSSLCIISPWYESALYSTICNLKSLIYLYPLWGVIWLLNSSIFFL
jgi:hypothetical protein